MLGMFTGLVVLALEKLFRWSQSRFANAFEVTWHLGVLVTAIMMLVTGTLGTLGVAYNAKALAGISGTGHMLLTAAFILLFVALGGRLRTSDSAEGADAVSTAEPAVVVS